MIVTGVVGVGRNDTFSDKIRLETEGHGREDVCDTRIFRPGNLMGLQQARVEAMVVEATRKTILRTLP